MAPAGSFNNELGPPYTVLKVDRGHPLPGPGDGRAGRRAHDLPVRHRAAGYRVVVNVGVAHIGEFGSVEAIAAAKGELVEALPAGGLAVLNADDPRVRAMASRTSAAVVLAGEAADADVRAEDVEPRRPGPGLVHPVTAGGRAPGPARRHRSRIRSATRCSRRRSRVAAGMALADVGRGLGDLRLVSTRRMDVFDRADGVTVIDDSYNANPASTAAALHALAAIGAGAAADRCARLHGRARRARAGRARGGRSARRRARRRP